MIRILVVATLLAACGKGDKCERAYAKLAPAMAKESKGKAPDQATMVKQCKDGLAKHPEQEKMLDCILAISGTPSIDDLGKCSEASGKGSLEDYKHRSMSSEAKLMLNKLGKSAKMAFVENGAFPKGKVGLTPAGECCASGQGKCAVDAAAWNDPVWQALDFSMDEPGYYRYSYESDGTTFTATAVGDLDCDTEMATFTAKGSVENGNPEVTIIEPAKPDE